MDLFGFGPEPREQTLSEALIVGLDFETTGLYPETDRVVEIGAVRSQGGKFVGEFSSLVDPGMIVPSDASRISGITTEMVSGQPIFADIAAELLEFLGDGIIVAHNLPFDIGFLTNELKRINLDVPQNLGLDSCLLAKKVITGMRSYSLQFLAKALNISAGTAHRALDDAKTCVSLVLECAGRLGTETNMGTLLDLGANLGLHR